MTSINDLEEASLRSVGGGGGIAPSLGRIPTCNPHDAGAYYVVDNRWMKVERQVPVRRL